MRWVLALGLVVLVGCASTPPEEEAAALAKEALLDVQRGDTAAALEKYEEALELNPSWSKVRFDYGRLSFEKGKVHFFNALQAEREADDAASAGQDQLSKDQRLLAETERDVAEGLFEQAERELRRVTQMRTNRDHEFNGFLTLAHIFAFKKDWENAKKFYKRALDMGPQGDAREPIQEAIRLMDAEIDRETSEIIGPKPE